MILKKMVEFAARASEEPSTKSLQPPMYQSRPVRYILDLDVNGQPIGKLIDTTDKEHKQGIEKMVPDWGKLKTSKPKATLIVDNGEYVFGIPRESKTAEKVQERHECYKQLIVELAKTVKRNEIEAIRKFIEAWKPDSSHYILPDDFDPGARIAFRIDDRYPTDFKEVQDFWANYTQDEDAPIMDCLVCGEKKPVLKRIANPIKGIPGGQLSGTSLISANSEAFESYGLEASLIAPTCRDCAEKFTYTINTLISTGGSHLRIGPLVYIYWTRKPSAFNPFNLINSPTPEMVDNLLQSVFKGKSPVQEDEMDNQFYATAFSASGGRAVLRDWIETTVPIIRRNLAHYFTIHRIVDHQGQIRVTSLRRLASATVPLRRGRPDEEKLAPQIPQALMRNALYGDPLPFTLLQAAINRCRAEQGVTSTRAALTKMIILNRNIIPSTKEDFMTQLELELKEPAYLCGRLLAVVEATQRAALGKITTTVTDRYYGAASSAPASVFGPLLRGVQAHLSKLRKTRMPVYLALDSRLQDILAGLKGNFPKTLTLVDQGLFALGYYHQKAKDRSDAQARILGLAEESINEASLNNDTETN
jgi:CRISPR-associated protein Csd1